MIRCTIRPHDVLDRRALTEVLGLDATTLARETRLGRLPCHRRGRRTFFLGDEVLAWLRAATDASEPTADDDGEGDE